MKYMLRSAWNGLVAGGFLALFLILPFNVAAHQGLGSMFASSAVLILAAGALLAWRMKIYPFGPKETISE